MRGDAIYYYTQIAGRNPVKGDSRQVHPHEIDIGIYALEWLPRQMSQMVRR